MIPFWKKTGKHSKPQSAQKRRQNAKPAMPRTAQQSIPMQRMFEDGTCRVKPNYYTRTIQYQDINYQLAQQEDKTAIFEEWCSFLNFFDSSIKFELSFVNMATDSTEFEKSIRIPFQKDGFDDVRAEYSQMLRQQLAKGNNGLTKTKFITFGVEGESMAQVKPRLDHIQNDLLNNFHRLGVQAKPLNGAQRLKLMHDMFNMDGASKFHFDWKDLVKSGLSVKDAIAPTAFAFKNSRSFQMGGIFCAASFLSITASDISDQLLKDFLDMDSSQIVTMHIQSVDQNKAIKTVKRTITELDRSKIEEQKKAIRAGYDIDIIPSDLATYGRDAKALLKELQSQNERMFLVTFLVLNTGRTEQELENNVFQASSIAQKHNCNLCRLDFQQEQGLMSSLPLADNQIEIQRGLTTSSTAIFIPFTTQELYQSGKESLYYGLNALSNNLIMVDRKKLKNPNGLILGTPGSGKSFSAKREIANAFLVTDDDIIVNDPEGEYSPLVNRLKGQVIKISPNSTQFINPMDINANYSEEDNPLSLKADFILSLCELVVGGKEGLLFAEQNGFSAPLTAGIRLRAKVVGGDAISKAFLAATNRVGLSLNYDSQQLTDYRIGCVGTAFRLYKQMGEPLYCETMRLIVAAWEGKPDSFRASVLKGMMHFVELYHGEFSEERLLRALRNIHPVDIYRIGQDDPAKLRGWKKYVFPIYTAYNGKRRKDALPMKF